MKPYLILLLMLVTSFAFGANIGDDKLNLGDGNNPSTDKEIIFNDGTASKKKLSIDGTTKNLKTNANNVEVGDNIATGDKSIVFKRGGSDPVIRWNETNDSLEFSKDGASYKKFGSGTGTGGDGGGVNFLLNSSFEDEVGGAVESWTAVGGSYTIEPFTDFVEGDEKFIEYTASASGQTFCSDAVNVPDDAGPGGSYSIKFNGAGASNFKMEVKEGVNVLGTFTFPSADEWTETQPESFTMPAPGTAIQFCLESTAAGVIQINKSYQGTTKNLVALGGANWYAGIKYEQTSCAWSATTPGDYPVDADCTGTVTGKATVPDTRIPAIKLPNAPAGTYMVVARPNSFINTAGDCSLGLNDSSTPTTNRKLYFSNLAEKRSIDSMVERFTYTSPGDRTIRIQLSAISSTPTCLLNGSPTSITEIDVFYYPAEAQIGVLPRTASFRVAAAIGGAAGAVTFNYANSTNAQQAVDAGMELVTDSDSSPVQIACATASSTGSTCSVGNEANGITLNIPRGGVAKVCNSFQIGALSNGDGATRIAMVTEGTTTILQEGRNSAYINDQGAADALVQKPRVCDFFSIPTAGRYSFKTLTNKGASGSLSFSAAQNGVTTGASALSYSRWELEMVAEKVPTPILVGNQVTSPGREDGAICQYVFGGAGSLAAPTSCTSSPCTLYFNSCDVTTPVLTRGGAGNYSLSIYGYKPSTAIHIDASSTGGLEGFYTGGKSTSGSGEVIGATVRSTTTGGVLTDGHLSIFAFGERP